MMTSPVVVVLQLVMQHGIDGREISVNPQQVTSLHAATSKGNKLVANEVRCIVGLADGKFVSVVETCDVVKRLLEGAK